MCSGAPTIRRNGAHVTLCTCVMQARGPSEDDNHRYCCGSRRETNGQTESFCSHGRPRFKDNGFDDLLNRAVRTSHVGQGAHRSPMKACGVGTAIFMRDVPNTRLGTGEEGKLGL